MSKKIAKYLKNFTLFSTCLMMLIAPSTVEAKSRASSINTVKKVIQKNFKNSGSKLGILSTEDTLSFSQNGGKGKVVTFEVKYDKTNEKVTGSSISLPYEVSSAKGNDKDASGKEIFTDGPYRFTLKKAVVSYAGKTKTVTKSSTSTSNNIINMDLGALDGVKNGDKVKVTVSLTWKRGKNYKINSAKTYTYNIEVTINAPEEEKLVATSPVIRQNLTGVGNNVGVNNNVQKLEKTGTRDLNLSLEYDKENDVLKNVVVSIPATKTLKLSDNKNWVHTYRIEESELYLNSMPEDTSVTSGKSTTKVPNKIELVGEKGISTSGATEVRAKIFLSWVRKNGKTTKSSALGTGGRTYSGRKTYVYEIVIPIDQKNADVYVEPANKDQTGNNNITVTPVSSDDTIIANTDEAVNIVISGDNKTYQEFSTKFEGNAKDITFYAKYDKSSGKITSASLKSPKTSVISVDGQNWNFTFNLQSCTLYVNGKKVKTVTKTSTKNSIITMDLGNFDAKNGDKIEAKIKLKWNRKNGKKSINSKTYNYDATINIPEYSYDDYMKGIVNTQYTTVEELAKNINKYLDVNVTRVNSDKDDYKVVVSNVTGNSTMSVYLNDKNNSKVTIKLIKESNNVKSGVLKSVYGTAMSYEYFKLNNGRLVIDKMGLEEITKKISGIMYVCYELEYNGTTYRNYCFMNIGKIELPQTKATYTVSDDNSEVKLNVEVTGKNLTVDVDKYHPEYVEENGVQKYTIQNIETFKSNKQGTVYVECKDKYGDAKLPISYTVDQIVDVTTDVKNHLVTMAKKDAVLAGKEQLKLEMSYNVSASVADVRLCNSDGNTVSTKTYSDVVIKVGDSEKKSVSTMNVSGSKIKADEKISVTYKYKDVEHKIEMTVPKDIDALKSKAIANVSAKELTPIYEKTDDGKVNIGIKLVAMGVKSFVYDGKTIYNGQSINKNNVTKTELSDGYTEYIIHNLLTASENEAGTITGFKVYGNDNKFYQIEIPYAVDSLVTLDILQSGTLRFYKKHHTQTNYKLGVDVDKNGNVIPYMYKDNSRLYASGAKFYLDNTEWSEGQAKTLKGDLLIGKKNIIVKFNVDGKEYEITMPVDEIRCVTVNQETDYGPFGVCYSNVFKKGTVSFSPKYGCAVKSLQLKKGSSEATAVDISNWSSSNVNVFENIDNLYITGTLIKTEHNSSLGFYDTEVTIKVTIDQNVWKLAGLY